MSPNKKKNERVFVGTFEKQDTGERRLVVFNNADALVGFSNDIVLSGYKICWQGIATVYSKAKDAACELNRS